MARNKAPPFLDIDRQQLEQMLERAEKAMPSEDFVLIKALASQLDKLTGELKRKNSSIRRIRKLFGIQCSEKTRDVLPRDDEQSSTDAAADDNGPGNNAADNNVPTPTDEPTSDAKVSADEAKPKGHGRLGASDYPKAQHIPVAHDTLRAGGPCPRCQGKLYHLREPSPTVRIVGSAPLQATVYDSDRLRCGTCLHVFTARVPEQAQGPKYDETAAAMLGLLHYRIGTPLNAIEALQGNLQTPVPSSTQWEVLEGNVGLLQPVRDELVRRCAQAKVLHIDDSSVRILELMGKRREALIACEKLDEPDRTGLFTTAIIGILGHGPIITFFSGRKHAGENLDNLLDLRDSGLPVPILMSDALNRNVPKRHTVIEANCMSHARRGIVDEVDNYPDACRVVLESLGSVYNLDEQLRQRAVSDEERLQAHQRESGPILDELHDWMKAALDDKHIEPNSSMGQALNYFLKRWGKLTLFLSVPGAPLDNNFAERVLKMAIKLRKTAMFYRSAKGARTGDTYMTIIHNAIAYGVNPYDYLTALLRNHKAVAESPGDWLPWTWEDSLARLQTESAA